jgi:hypothetical protein
MVKVGFIVEGDTEKILVESDNFKKWLINSDIELIRPVLNAKGGGNLLPENIDPMIVQLKQNQAEFIVILTDLEYETSEESVKNRISNPHTNLIFVAIKAIEAWFLADSSAMNKWLEVDSFYEERPEQTPDLPWERLKEIARDLDKRGPGSSKPAFAKKMVNYYDFQFNQSASHANCPSAKRFHDGLLALANN